MAKLALVANDEPEATKTTFEQDTVIDKEIKHGGNEGDEIAKAIANEDNYSIIRRGSKLITAPI